MKALRQPQGANRPDTGFSVQNNVGLPSGPCVVEEGNSNSSAPSHSTNENAQDIGEVDTVEDSIDGMGAIKFTDEEDCGYFGSSCSHISPIPLKYPVAESN